VDDALPLRLTEEEQASIGKLQEEVDKLSKVLAEKTAAREPWSKKFSAEAENWNKLKRELSKLERKRKTFAQELAIERTKELLQVDQNKVSKLEGRISQLNGDIEKLKKEVEPVAEKIQPVPQRSEEIRKIHEAINERHREMAELMDRPFSEWLFHQARQIKPKKDKRVVVFGIYGGAGTGKTTVTGILRDNLARRFADMAMVRNRRYDPDKEETPENSPLIWGPSGRRVNYIGTDPHLKPGDGLRYIKVGEGGRFTVIGGPAIYNHMELERILRGLEQGQEVLAPDDPHAPYSPAGTTFDEVVHEGRRSLFGEELEVLVIDLTVFGLSPNILKHVDAVIPVVFENEFERLKRRLYRDSIPKEDGGSRGDSKAYIAGDFAQKQIQEGLWYEFPMVRDLLGGEVHMWIHDTNQLAKVTPLASARSELRLDETGVKEIAGQVALLLQPKETPKQPKVFVNRKILAKQSRDYVQKAGIEAFADALYRSIGELSDRIREEVESTGEMTEVMARRYQNMQKVLTVLQEAMAHEFDLRASEKIAERRHGASLAIALDEQGQILALPISVPAGELAQALRRLAGNILKKVIYVTDTQVPDVLRHGVGIPTKRVPIGGRIGTEGPVSLIGEAKVSDATNIFEMRVEGNGREVDPMTADLLVHLMVVVGTMIHYGSKGDLIRKAQDPVAELLKQYPGLSVILNHENLKFTERNGKPAFVFAVRALQEKLAEKAFAAAA
jgi:hypothetical protein